MKITEDHKKVHPVKPVAINYVFLGCLAVILVICQFISGGERAYSHVAQYDEQYLHKRYQRSTSKFNHDVHGNIHAISARAGEVEFFRLTLGTGKNGKSHIEIRQVPQELEIIEHVDPTASKPSYPDQLLAKLKESESKSYYIQLIENAALQMEGRDLIWWGYNKTHEFLIDKDTLEKLDINSLSITDNLAAKFGTTEPKKQPTAPMPHEKMPSTALSWGKLTTNTKIKPAGVVLMSLLASELQTVDNYFNQHSDVFYQYEPLKLIADGCASSTAPAKIDFLDELFSCRHTDLTERLQSLKTRDEKASRYVGKGGIAFRYKSSRLCRGDFCEGKDFSADEEQCIKECPDVELEKINQLCEEKLPTIKLVRICNLANLEPVVKNRNLKVVVVLRDPRSVAFKRANVFSSWSKDQLVNNVKWMCHDMTKSLKLALQEQPPWLEDRLMIVRAEDVLPNATFWLDSLSKFSAIGTEKINNEEFLEQESEQAQAWRNSQNGMTFEMVEEIQEVCSEMMQLSGYKMLSDAADLADISKRLH